MLRCNETLESCLKDDKEYYNEGIDKIKTNPFFAFNIIADKEKNKIRNILKKHFDVLDQLINPYPYDCMLFIALDNIYVLIKNEYVMKPNSHYGPFALIPKLNYCFDNTGYKYQMNPSHKYFILCYSIQGIKNIKKFSNFIINTFSNLVYINGLVTNNLYIVYKNDYDIISNAEIGYNGRIYFPEILTCENHQYILDSINCNIQYTSF